MKLKFVVLYISLIFVFLVVGCSKTPSQPSSTPAWQAINNGLPENTTVQSIACAPSDPNIIYVGTYSGVYKTKNNGKKWTACSQDLPLSDVSAVAVHPNDASHVYAGTWGRGLSLSKDGGDTWQDIWPDDAQLHITRITTSILMPDAVWVGTEKGLYKSNDQGVTWSHVYPSGRVTAVSVHPRDPSIAYMGIDIQGTFKSTNGGSSWTKINNGLYSSGESTAAANSFAFYPGNAQQIFMSTGWVDLYKTVNGGKNWQKTADLLTELDVKDVVIHPDQPQRLWALTQKDGIYTSKDGGVSWSPMNDGYPGKRAYDMCSSTGNSVTLYVGTLGHGIYKYDHD